jgi:hypothetical protein
VLLRLQNALRRGLVSLLGYAAYHANVTRQHCRQRIDFSWSPAAEAINAPGQALLGANLSHPVRSFAVSLARALDGEAVGRDGHRESRDVCPKIRETRRQVMPTRVRLGVTG